MCGELFQILVGSGRSTPGGERATSKRRSEGAWTTPGWRTRVRSDCLDRSTTRGSRSPPVGEGSTPSLARTACGTPIGYWSSATTGCGGSTGSRASATSTTAKGALYLRVSEGLPGSFSSYVSGSVGLRGRNAVEDMTQVQGLLEARGFDVGLVDGVCGGRTRAAIRAFQSSFQARPDARVDPDGATWRRLTA